MAGDRQNDRIERQVGVRDVGSDDAVGLQMLQVNLERFGGEQVRGDGVAAEGIEHQHIKLLRLLALEDETGIADDGFGSPEAIAQIGEVLAGGDVADGVDFIEAVDVSGFRKGGERSNAKSDDTDLQSRALLSTVQHLCDAGFRAVVGERLRDGAGDRDTAGRAGCRR